MAKPIKIVILGDATGLTTTLGKADGELAAFGTKLAARGASIKSWGDDLAAAGKTMSLAVTAPLVALGAYSAKQAVDFEADMNLLVTAAGETRANLEKVSDGVLDIARSTGVSTDQLSEGIYQIEKAGYRGSDALSVLKSAAQGAVAENVPMQDMANAVTSVMQSYKDVYPAASDAVDVTNQMIVASGSAKVTMGEFAGSLSSVLPQASALHVSFADIGAAIATMTQHGTSAKQATDDLNNTLRALAAPNRVAITELQQLGFGAQDLQESLGKVGLAGTLDKLVTQIMTKMGPSGKVLLDTFNQSKSAAQDANTMLAAMPENARKLSEAYRDGSMSLGDWIKATKAMDPASANLARQYKTIEDKARGFNQQLRQGDPNAQLFTEALKKATNGAVGMNTVLQLTGASMPFYEDALKRIGEAAHGSGGDIETWADTVKTTKVQAAQLKEQLQTTAITLGQALIPALKDAITAAKPFIEWVRDMATKFKNASDGTKSMIVNVALFMAILGPAMVVVGKFVSLVGSLVSTIGRVAGVVAKGVGALRNFATGFANTERAATSFGNKAIVAGANVRSAMNTTGTAIARTASFVGSQVAGVGRDLARLGTAVVRPAQNFVAGFSSSAAAASRFTGVMGTLGGVASRNLQYVSDSARLALGPMVSSISRVGSSLTQAATAPLKNFVAGMMSTQAAASSFTGSMGTIGGAVSRVSTSIGTTAARAFGSLADAATAGMTRASSAVQSLAASIHPLSGVLLGATAVIGIATMAWQRHAAAQAAATARSKDLASAIQQDNLALGVNTRYTLAKQLSDDGAFTAANKLGFSQKTLTDALMGNSAALAKVKAVTESLTPPTEAYVKATGDSAGAISGASTAQAEFKAKFDAAAKSMGEGQGIARDLSAAMDGTAGAAQLMGGSIDAAKQIIDNARQAIQALADAQRQDQDSALAVTNAQIQAMDAIDGVTSSVQQNGTSFDITTAAGRQNTQAVLAAIQAAEQHRDAVLKQTDSVEQANAAFQADIGQLQGVSGQSADTATAVQGLIDKYGTIPPSVDTKINADASNAETAIQTIKAGMAMLQDKTIKINMDIAAKFSGQNTSGVPLDYYGNPIQKAAGGPVSGPGTGTSDSIPARLSNGEYVIPAAQASKYRAELDAMRNGTYGAPSATGSGSGTAAAPAAQTKVEINVHGSNVPPREIADELMWALKTNGRG